MKNLISSYTRFACVVYSGEVKGEVGTRSGMRCVGWVVGSGTFYCRIESTRTHNAYIVGR